MPRAKQCCSPRCKSNILSYPNLIEVFLTWIDSQPNSCIVQKLLGSIYSQTFCSSVHLPSERVGPFFCCKLLFGILQQAVPLLRPFVCSLRTEENKELDLCLPRRILTICVRESKNFENRFELKYES